MKFIIYGLSILLGILLYGCIEDSTNRDLLEVNRIQFSGIEEEYVRNMGDSLIIEPEFIFSLAEDMGEEYSYLWFLSTSQTMYAADTLSEEKDLRTVITTPPGNYHLNYKVTNKHTGVFDSYQCDVRVDGAYSRGILILAEKDGYAQLNFLPVNGQLITSVYQGANNEKLGEHPVAVVFVNPSKSRPALKEVFVLNQDARGGACLNPDNLQKRVDIRKAFFSDLADEIVESELYFKPRNAALADYLIVGGKVYNRSYNMGELRFKAPLVADEKGYHISRWHFSNPSAAWFYDEQNRRFLAHKTANKGELIAFRAVDEQFDPRQVGLDLVCGGFGKTGRPNRIFGLFKEPETEKYSVLLINVDPTNYTMDLEGKYEINDEMHLLSASCYEIPNYLYFNYLIFYALESKIYAYNAETNVSELLYDFQVETNRDIVVDCLEVASKTELRVGIREMNREGKQGGYALLKMTELGGLGIDRSVAPVIEVGFCDKVVDFETKE